MIIYSAVLLSMRARSVPELNAITDIINIIKQIFEISAILFYFSILSENITYKTTAVLIIIIENTAIKSKNIVIMY